MSRSNRADVSGFLGALGIDASGAGLPAADGLQPVLDLARTPWVPRNLFGQFSAVAGAVSQRGTVELICNVPTLVWLGHLDPSAGTSTLAASNASSPVPSSGLAVISTRAVLLRHEGTLARNVLYHGTTTATSTSSLPLADSGGTGKSDRQMWPLIPFPMPAGSKLQLQASTTNTLVSWSIVWEESLIIP